PRARTGSSADPATQTRLPLSFCVEVSQPGKTQFPSAFNAGLCRTAQDSAPAGDCGCRCGVVDVRGSRVWVRARYGVKQLDKVSARTTIMRPTGATAPWTVVSIPPYDRSRAEA